MPRSPRPVPPGPDRAKVETAIEEPLRYLALLPAVLDREAYLLSQEGYSHIRRRLVELFQEANAPQTKVGMKHGRFQITDEQYTLLESLPWPRATGRSSCRARGHRDPAPRDRAADRRPGRPALAQGAGGRGAGPPPARAGHRARRLIPDATRGQPTWVGWPRADRAGYFARSARSCWASLAAALASWALASTRA